MLRWSIEGYKRGSQSEGGPFSSRSQEETVVPPARPVSHYTVLDCPFFKRKRNLESPLRQII